MKTALVAILALGFTTTASADGFPVPGDTIRFWVDWNRLTQAIGAVSEPTPNGATLLVGRVGHERFDGGARLALTDGRTLEARPDGTIEGNLLSIEADWLAVRVSGESVAVPLRALHRLRFSRGKSVGFGMLNGAVIGAFSAVVVAAATGGQTDTGDTESFAPSLNFTSSQRILLAAVPLVPLGALFGAAAPPTRWETARGGPRFTLGPVRGGGAGLTVTF